MKRLYSLMLVAALSIIATLSAQTNYTVSLSGAQEVPVNPSLGSGSGTLTLTGNTLFFDGLGISYAGLSANVVAMHIHGPTNVGFNANVKYDLIALGNASAGGTSGTISGSVTLSDPPQTGGAYSLDQQIADLNNGLWYINIHTSTSPGGEIRGQIVPVPEPAIVTLMGLGAGTLLWRVRRRR